MSKAQVAKAKKELKQVREARETVRQQCQNREDGALGFDIDQSQYESMRMTLAILTKRMLTLESHIDDLENQ
jgi:hypothetical protein